MANIFKQLFMPSVAASAFDLSHDVKMSFNMGSLIPSSVMEVLPGDKFTISTEKFLRFMPLASPMMHRCSVTCHFFFVPTRILWSGWEDFITGQSEDVPPWFDITATQTIPEGSLGDYLGLPKVVSTQQQISALPVAAYLKIWDEYYRDQNLQSEEFVDLIAGNNGNTYEDIAAGQPLKRAWNHDYFTSCLPFSQKGDEVTLPLLNNDTADVQYKTGLSSTDKNILRNVSTDVPSPNETILRTDANSQLEGNVSGSDLRVDLQDTHEVDVNAEATTINTLRRAFRLQEFLEKDARGGTRYIENIKAHFGISSSDKRLQRPEYIGGSKNTMTISEVLSTAQTVDQSSNDIPIGELKGHGVGVSGGNRFSYRAEEHGFIMGILNVQPITAYQQGLHRSWTRFDRTDYAWPQFANIGEQAVLNKEIYGEESDQLVMDNIFGYIPRYSEYKYMPNRVAGEFKSRLNFWHLGRIFTSTPSLNNSFIECNPSHRVFSVTDIAEHKVLAHVINNVTCVRKLPKFGIPTI